jgi:uncharacterized circularly permuted ATP-grasp superfamily protein/uncharacterized alpha-E superfamily protein
MTLADIGRDGASGIVDGYRAAYLQGRLEVDSSGRPDRPVSGPAADELLERDGAVRSGWQDLAATVDLLGAEGMRRRDEQARRLLEDEGVTYGSVVGDEAPGRWRLDPLPVIVDHQEWAELSPGLIQRAELMDLLLADLYGPRDLLRRGLIPPAVVLAHAGFMRPCDGIRLPGPSQLVMAAIDVVRGPHGWMALGDRTQAPSGAGYAMENRRIVSRVMTGLYRDTLLERLRSFFHAVRAALHEVAPSVAEAPRVVILTPGPNSETAFDQAFLSTLLGFPLVEGQDLTVRDGRVWMRSLGRPEPVDVILRRVDGWFCDPLELRADSRLGVPGLLQAARLGRVSIVNPPGSAVLENPGLVPFLPALSRALLDAPLLLDSVPTWWCGDPDHRRFVLANLDRLVLRPIARGIGRANRFGWELSAEARTLLRARIEAEPHAWSAQEPVAMSTAPVMTSSGLSPRSLVLRSFAVATGGRFRLMAGGLGRVAATPGSLDVSSLGGALAKDVWVIGARTVTAAGAGPQRGLASRGGDDVDPVPIATGLSSRVAEDMFWLGRYAERAEDAARLLRVAADLAGDHTRRPGSVGFGSLAVMLRALTAVTTTYPGFAGSADLIARPQAELVRLSVDAFAPGTLAHAVRRTVEAAHSVRELLSTDTWLVLGALDRVLLELGRAREPDVDLPSALSRVLEGLLALSGLAMESMVRDWSWHLMDAGRRLERAMQVVALLRHALAERYPAAVDDVVLESVLISAESIITHRRRRPGRPRVDGVLDLLLLDRDNPRGVQHQLDRLGDDLARLPAAPAVPNGAASEPADPRARLLAVQARLQEVDVHELSRAAEPATGATGATGEAGRETIPRTALVTFLDGLWQELADLADAVAATHFARAVPPTPMPATPTVDVR